MKSLFHKSKFLTLPVISLLIAILVATALATIGAAQEESETLVWLPYVTNGANTIPPVGTPNPTASPQPNETPLPTQTPTSTPQADPTATAEPSQRLLEISQISDELRAVEGDNTGVTFELSRINDSSTVSFQLLINETTSQRIHLEAQAHIQLNPEPRSDFFFPNNTLVCDFSNPAGNGSNALSTSDSDDYSLFDEDGNLITDSITFAENELTKQIIIKAAADSHTEVPELLEIEVLPAAGYLVHGDHLIETLLVEGANEVTDNSLLFIGQMSAEGGAQTSATGTTTVRLAEDNSFALISMNFSGLTTEQTAAHIHIANPDSGPVAFSLPLGQFTNINWAVKAAQFVTTDQEMLDRLLSGGLYTNVHTAKYPAGEIKGGLVKADGAINPNFDYPAPDYNVLTGDALIQDIVRFLRQSTFGPTPELVAELEARIATANGDRIAAYSAWLDDQMQLQSPSHHEYYKAARNQWLSTVPASDLDTVTQSALSRHVSFYGGWFASAVHAKAHLREKVGFALSEIFVVSTQDNLLDQRREGIAAYNDMLKNNAFGDYETLLTDVSKHPVMGIYLSHLQNQQDQFDENGTLIASPDENYAREVMQLFSIGLIERHPDYIIKLDENGLPIQTYTQTDITELSRVFTGWGLSVQSVGDGETSDTVANSEFEYDLQPRRDRHHSYLAEPMKSFNDNGYDPTHKKYAEVRDQGQKTVLGEVFSAGQTGEQDLAQIMGILSDHPNTAPFISYRLIQRLVTSNPSAGYVYRVSTTFSDSNGDLGETIKAILLDPEARNLDLAQTVGYGRVHEPLVRTMSMYRLMDIEYNNEADYPTSGLTAFGLPASELNLYANDVKRIPLSPFTIDSEANGYEQTPLSAPTVFNWFLPSFTPAGPIAQAGLVAPELQHMNAAIAVKYYNHINSFTSTNGSNGPLGLAHTYEGTRPRLNMIDLPLAVEAYMDVMDTNNDNTISELDTTFDDTNAIRQAVADMVDTYDLYICDGWFSARATGNSATDPREIIIDGISSIHDYNDGKTEERAITARDKRLRETFIILYTAPQCMIQK